MKSCRALLTLILAVAVGLASVADAGVYLRRTTSTGVTTIGPQDSMVVITATGGAKVATLPPCPSSIGRYGQALWIVNASASDSAVTVTRDGTDTIGTSATTYSLAAANDSVMLACQSSGKWTVVGSASAGVAQTLSALLTAGAGLDMNGTAITIGADGGLTLDETADDVLALTFGAGAGTFSTLVGNVKVGNGSPDVSLNGEDCYVEGTFEVDGAARVDGALTANTGATIGGGDVTVTADATGGNAGAKNELIGKIRSKLVSLGTATNGAAAGKTLALSDDTPSGEWTAHDADTVASDDGTYYRAGTKSLKIEFTVDADAGDGAHDGVAYDFSDDESAGLAVMCNGTFSAGDLVLDLTDDGGGHAVNLPAIAAANVWQWAELDLSGIANGDKDVISDLSLELSAAGAVVVAGRATNCYFDRMFKWDATEEEALGVAIVQDGVGSVVAIATAAGTANTPTDLVEDTDFFTHYESGNDFIVWVTDQSAASTFGLVSY